MSLQDILKKIFDESQKQVALIEAETQKKKEALVEEYEKKASEELAVLDVKAEKAQSDVEAKVAMMARRENARALLASKQKVIDEGLEMLVTHLEGVKDEVYVQLLKKLFASLGTSEGTVFVPAKRLGVSKETAPKGMEVEAKDGIEGGFVFLSADKKEEVDSTFRNLVLSEYRSLFTTYLAEQLKLV